MEEVQVSRRFRLVRADILDILKVAVWAGASAALGSLALSLGNVEFPPEYAFLVPIINTTLVALKRLVESRIVG